MGQYSVKETGWPVKPLSLRLAWFDTKMAHQILSSEYKALFVMLRVQLLLYRFVQPKK